MENRKLTKDIITIKDKDIFHYSGGDYKPWWSACNNGNLKVTGYNGCDPSSLMGKVEDLPEEGKMLMNTDYLIEVEIKVTRLEKVEK